MTHHALASGGDGDLERRLEAYALARLSASVAASARMRARVMREATLVATGGPATSATTSTVAAVAGGVPTVRPSASARVRSSSRRFVPALLAAAFALVVLTGGALAARPGGPLYGVRLLAEEATLPAGGAGRVEAELDRLQERLDEADEAASVGDRSGVVAALAAYATMLDQTMADVASDPKRADRLESALQTHLDVLAALGTRVPDPAREALARAVDRGQRALDVVLGDDGPGPKSGNGQGNGNVEPGRGNGNGNGNGSGNGKGQGTGDHATPRPARGPDGTPRAPDERPGRSGD